MSVFADYDGDSFFDEAHDEHGGLRPHYRALVDQMGAFPPGELARREQLRDEAFRTAGITFTVYGESEGVERTFPLDLVPRVIPHDEWEHLERGLVQRITVLNRFLEDLYVGERAAVRDGVIPWWLVASSTGFVREAAGIEVPHAARCLVAGVDIVRDDAGTYRVLEDNLRNPSGISYVLENRQAMTRVLPRIFANLGVLFRTYLKQGNEAFDDLPGGPRGYQLLVSAARGEPTSQLALSRRLGVDRTVMTYLIDDLVNAGLVERHVDPTDRRARRIRATAKGQKLLPELDRRLHDVEATVLVGLSKADADRFRRLLRTAADELDRTNHVDSLSDIPSEMSGRRKRTN